MNRKKWVAVGILCMIIMCIVIVAVNLKQMPPKLSTDNGDEIILNEVSYTRVNTDYVFEVLPAEDYEDKNGLGLDIKLPADIENLQHYYQINTDDNIDNLGNIGLHDEVFLWETSKYKYPSPEVIEVTRNDGEQRVLADRGYIQMTVTRADRPLQMYAPLFSEEMKFVKSYMNEKTVIAVKMLYPSDGDRGTYEAIIKDAYGEGNKTFIIANNIEEAYFVRLLEIVTGTKDSFAGVDYDTVKDSNATQAEMAEAAEALAIENAAQRIIDSALLEKFKNGEISYYSYINYPSYKEAVKTYDGKKYNVSCDYDISYEDNTKRVIVKRFLYMEKIFRW